MGEVGLVTEEKSQVSLTQGTSGSSAGTWHTHLLRAELVLQPSRRRAGLRRKALGASVLHILVH